LRAWGVKIESESRLHKARAVLEKAAVTGALVPKHRGDLLGHRSLELSYDYLAIAETLPANRVASLRRELGQSLIGDVEPKGNKRGPLQLQSQGIVRAAFVRGGLVPRHPTHSPHKGKSPDLLLDRGPKTFAIETKRPEHSKNVERNFDAGHDQLTSSGLVGGVVIDATDCVRGLSGRALSDEISRLVSLLYARAFDEGLGHKPGFENIIIAGVFARVAWRSDDGEDKSMVSVHSSTRVGVLAPGPGTEADIAAKWIRKAFQEGLHGLSEMLVPVGS
jgi:hypothetical protein